MDILNRVDKRDLIKKAKKKAEFAKKLTPLQQEYINEVVEAGKDYARINLMNCFDISVQGALIERTNLNYKEIENIVYRCGELMKECDDILKKVSMEERIMSVKAIEKEVAEKIAKMVFERKERKDIVKAIKEEYKGTGLTTPEINVYYKKGLESYERFMNEQEGLKKAAEIKEAINENKIEEAIETIIEPIEIKESKFKVTNKIVKVVSCDVAGDHGEYRINNGAVTIKGTAEAFINIPAVLNWASDKREELLKEVERLDNLKSEIIEVMKEFILETGETTNDCREDK